MWLGERGGRQELQCGGGSLDVAGELWLWAAHRVSAGLLAGPGGRRPVGQAAGSGAPHGGQDAKAAVAEMLGEDKGSPIPSLPLLSLGGARQLMRTYNREWLSATGWGVTAVEVGTVAQVSWCFGAGSLRSVTVPE